MADILVTGATGLLGPRVVARLTADGHDVFAVARRPPALPSGAQWVNHDLARPALPSSMPPRVDAVVHLAQGRGFRNFPAEALATYAVNVASTALLLDWAVRAGARRFVLASTGGVYRDSCEPHTEYEPVRLADAGLSFYAASKLAAEALALAYGSELTVTVLRPFFIYGEGQEPTMLVPRLVESVRNGRAVTLAGENGFQLNPVHVSDAADAVVAALTLDEGGVINVAGPQVLSLRDLVDTLAREMGTAATFDVVGERPASNVIGDTTLMAARLGPPRTVLSDVVMELCRGTTE